jgi:hypothetical protein
MIIDVNNKVRIPLIDSENPFFRATDKMHYVGCYMLQYPNDCILALKKVQDYELLVPGDDYVIETNGNRIICQLQKIRPGYFTAYFTNDVRYKDGNLMYPPIDIPIKSIGNIYKILGYLTN